MLKYVVILLDKTSAAFCHADNPYNKPCLMPLPILKDAILWAMKENLMIQFVYPDYKLPIEYNEVIDAIDHIDIGHDTDNDVVIIEGIIPYADIKGKNVALRVDFNQFIHNVDFVVELLRRALHLSVVIKDIDCMTEPDFELYKECLSRISAEIETMYSEGCSQQFNLITDRLVLDKMNNCNAGWESITIAPNGRFYICPAFFYSDENDNVGSLEDDLAIKNQQLYRLDYAPICRNCDAYQCHR